MNALNFSKPVDDIYQFLSCLKESGVSELVTTIRDSRRGSANDLDKYDEWLSIHFVRKSRLFRKDLFSVQIRLVIRVPGTPPDSRELNMGEAHEEFIRLTAGYQIDGLIRRGVSDFWRPRLIAKTPQVLWKHVNCRCVVEPLDPLRFHERGEATVSRTAPISDEVLKEAVNATTAEKVAASHYDHLQYPAVVAPGIWQYDEHVFVWLDETGNVGGAHFLLTGAQQEMKSYGDALNKAQPINVLSSGNFRVTFEGSNDKTLPTSDDILLLISDLADSARKL